MRDQEFIDLARLAVERTLREAQSVLQLVDNDEDRCSVLIAIAAEMLNGAAQLEQTDERTYSQAMQVVFRHLAQTIALMVRKPGRQVAQ